MATSKMQIEVGDLLDKELPGYRIRENFRPDWFISSEGTRLEIDFYIEELKIAFEVQGDQHYRYVPFFHKDQADFERRKKFDEEKKELCAGYGIKFYEICTKTDAVVAVREILSGIQDQPKYSYSKYRRKEQPSKFEKKCTYDSGRERLNRAKENLAKYLRGEIDATEEKVAGWKEAIKKDGMVLSNLH